MTDDDFYASLNDDNEIAFTQVVEMLDSKLRENIASLDDRDDPRYFQQDYMNKVVAAAGALEVDEIANFDVPPIQHDFSGAYDEFSLALQRFVMKVSLRKVRTGKVYSVELSAADKERVHGYVKKIRNILEGADLDERKRNSLYAKLNAFDADVDRARTPFNNAMLMALDVAYVAKAYGEALNPLSDLVKRINDLLASAKSKEPEAAQLPPPEQKKKLPPPPKQIEGPKLSRDLDDDIPF
ncbi:hypothetical protein [Martelella sp. HB161492]|uniref:hypothetical protein n=1 Tax=Martelella sp. HB161492 TaxID=2720726 RepID=UPI001590590D|nr:hypothetical protein [Martelella sp. HB161492]